MSRPIIMVHGLSCTPGVWDRMVTALTAEGFQCHALALPLHTAGQGDSALLPTLGIEDYVQALLGEVQQLKLPCPPVLMGHSMGGLVVQMMATRMDVEALVLLASSSPAGVGVADRNAFASFAEVLTTPSWWARSHTLRYATCREHMFNNLSELKSRREYAAMVPESGKAIFQVGTWALDPANTTRVHPSQIHCPIHLFGGAMDKIISIEAQRELAHWYPGAALTEYPYNAHWLIDEDGTDVVVRDIVRWLDSPDRDRDRVDPAGLAERGVPASPQQQSSWKAVFSKGLSMNMALEVSQKLLSMGRSRRGALEHALNDTQFQVSWGLVARVPMFSTLSAEQIAQLASSLRPLSVEAGEVVVRQGEAGDSMFFVLSGELDVLRPDKTATSSPGEFFGEIALILGGERMVTVRANQPSHLLELCQSELQVLLRSKPELVEQLREVANTRRDRLVALNRGATVTP